MEVPCCNFKQSAQMVGQVQNTQKHFLKQKNQESLHMLSQPFLFGSFPYSGP